MTDILDRIEAYKRTEIAEAKVRMPRATLERNVRDHDPPRGFVHAIEEKLGQRRIVGRRKHLRAMDVDAMRRQNTRDLGEQTGPVHCGDGDLRMAELGPVSGRHEISSGPASLEIGRAHV